VVESKAQSRPPPQSPFHTALNSDAVAFGALVNELNKNTVLRALTLYLVRTTHTVCAGLDIGLCGSAVGYDRMECEGFSGLNVFENVDAVSHDE
jgi:hypothetical protein